jgi:hypothetical protein
MRTETIVVGAGQAGFALSYSVRKASRDHAVLACGGVADRWRSERWDSLRLLALNWMNMLPHARDDHTDPDGLMTTFKRVTSFECYAASFWAPVAGIDVRAESIGTVSWATGFRPSYPWRHLPVLGASGEIQQRPDVRTTPGLYVLGLRLQYHRNSNVVGGVCRDAEYVARQIVERSSLKAVAA